VSYTGKATSGFLETRSLTHLEANQIDGIQSRRSIVVIRNSSEDIILSRLVNHHGEVLTILHLLADME
jgi:hypothetical protein